MSELNSQLQAMVNDEAARLSNLQSSETNASAIESQVRQELFEDALVVAALARDRAEPDITADVYGETITGYRLTQEMAFGEVWVEAYSNNSYGDGPSHPAHFQNQVVGTEALVLEKTGTLFKLRHNFHLPFEQIPIIPKENVLERSHRMTLDNFDWTPGLRLTETADNVRRLLFHFMKQNNLIVPYQSKHRLP